MMQGIVCTVGAGALVGLIMGTIVVYQQRRHRQGKRAGCILAEVIEPEARGSCNRQGQDEPNNPCRHTVQPVSAE